MEPARVLLVEDDASLQRFVSLALAELPLTLQCCDNVDAALALLKAQSVQLILTDLMLPGRSGFELIETLVRQQAGPLPRIVVFSAGLSPTARARLEKLPVWRLLAKPCTVLGLEACVREALDAGQAVDAVSPPRRQSAAALAVVRNFGGNQALYDSYRAGCLQQFAADAQAGDAACLAHDAAALHRLAHNLKTVLLLLGHDEVSGQARLLEHAASTAAWDAALPQRWQGLKRILLMLD